MSEENTQQEDVPTPRNTTSTVEDLITLPVLDETALLQNIKIRFQADLIYVCYLLFIIILCALVTNSSIIFINFIIRHGSEVFWCL